jgi:putative ABC transport system permease protein
MNEIRQDVRFAFRLLRRERGFTVTAIFVLGIGIGINNMFFTILYAHTMRGLPIPGVDRLVHVSGVDDRSADRALSLAEFTAIRDARTLTDVAAFTSGPVTVAGNARAAERLEAVYVSPNALPLIRAVPVRGRGFTAEDDRQGAAPVALLGAASWRARFAGDAAVLGQSVLVNGAAVTIVGITPDESGLPAAGQIWLPLRDAPGLNAQPTGARTLRLLGRMRDGATIAEVTAEVDGLIARAVGETSTKQHVRARVIPINDRFFGRLGDPAWRAFIAASVLVALIACANAANLMLVRSARRARELAIRASVGASRRRLMRQLLIESAVLAGIGGLLGLGVSIGGVRLFRTAIPERALPYWIHYSIDGWILAALAGVSMTTVVLFGLLPAIRASKADVNRVLKEGGRPASTDRGTRRWATTFLVAEFALAVVLLAKVVVSMRSSGPVLSSDQAIETNAVVTASITIPAATYAGAPQRLELIRRLEERVAAIAGVSAVSVCSAAPLTGAVETQLLSSNREPVGTVRTVIVGSRYFDTLAVPIIRGRGFADSDSEPGSRHVIVNERFARRFSGGDPIGRQIALATDDDAVTIVGLVADVRQRPLPEPDPIVYLPYRGTGSASVQLIVRSATDLSTVVAGLRREVLALDPLLPIDRIQTMATVVRAAQWNQRVSQRLLLLLTTIAVALSVVGLYAVTAHGVAQRSQEIGVRMALGARPRQVMSLVARRVLSQVVLGFFAGVLCTLAWDRTFEGGRADLSIVDPRTLGAIALTLAAAALIACCIPAWRAMRLDPVAAIRGD